MPLRRFLIVLLAITLFSLLHPATTNAVEQYGWINGHNRGPVPYYIGNPKRIDVVQATAPAAIGHYPPGQVQAGPRAYPYGYFGAQYRPYSVFSSNYYNDFSQWSFRRGY